MRFITSYALVWAFCFTLSGVGYSTDFSGFFLNPSINYTSQLSETDLEWTEQKAKSETKSYNITAGYSLSGGLLIGLKYLSQIRKSLNETWGEEESTVDLKAAGLSFGFINHGLCAYLSSYSIQKPKLTYPEQEWEYTSGSGSSLEFIYLIDVGGWWIGPHLAFHNQEFKAVSSGNTNYDESFIKLNYTTIEHYLSLFILM